MTNTPILDIVEIAETQTDRYLTINAAINALETAGNGIEVDTSTGTTTVDYSNATGTPATYLGNFFFNLTGTKSGAFDMTLPDVTPVGAIAITRVFAVANTTGQTVTIQSETAGTSLTLATADSAIYFQNANVIIKISPDAASAPTIPYDIAIFQASTPITDQIIAEIEVGRAITIPDDFAGSQANIGVNATATYVIDIQKNGVDVGDVSFDTSGTPTWTTDAGAITLVAGDLLSFDGQTTVDATIANIAITIVATVD